MTDIATGSSHDAVWDAMIIQAELTDCLRRGIASHKVNIVYGTMNSPQTPVYLSVEYVSLHDCINKLFTHQCIVLNLARLNNGSQC